MKSFLILTSLLGLSFSSFAQEYNEDPAVRMPAQVIIQDREVMERAKSHNYRGGAEEGELRVQAKLPKAQRKIAPVIDKTDTEKESQDHD